MEDSLLYYLCNESLLYLCVCVWVLVHVLYLSNAWSNEIRNRGLSGSILGSVTNLFSLGYI